MSGDILHADALAQMYPSAKVDRNVLYVDDGNLITSRKPEDIPAFNKALLGALADQTVPA